MTNETEIPTNGPKYRAYHVVTTEDGQKERWIRLGAFFEHANGKGATLLLDALPIAGFDGRIVLRAPKE